MRALAHRRFARWMALVATCASLAVTGATLWQAPRFERPVAAVGMVLRATAAAPRVARAEAARPPRARQALATTAPGPRAQAPATRPLYLLNRSLLR